VLIPPLAPLPAASPSVVPAANGSATVANGPAPSATANVSHDEPCEEGERYRCTGGGVVDCAAGAGGVVSARVIGHCLHGCLAEGTALDDASSELGIDGLSREAAFAMLCSR
jgi:hypothetical protein